MATIASARLSRLGAVNTMLRSVGETPVNSLASGFPLAALAEGILDDKVREILEPGWTANTRLGVTLTRDSNNQFLVGQDVLNVYPSNGPPRADSRPRYSSYLEFTVRESTLQAGKFVLYDVNNDRDTWPNDEQITVDLVSLLDFEALPPHLQFYIQYAAAHQFQKGAMQSRVLREFTQEDVENALAHAVDRDMTYDKTNILRDNPSSYAMTYRRNPLHGS